jgi:hypothetical protein
MSVAAIPLAAGITGDAYRNPVAFSSGFRTAMWISASLGVVGAVLAFVTLADRRPTGAKPARPVLVANGTHHRSCPLESPPLSCCPGSTSTTSVTRH